MSMWQVPAVVLAFLAWLSAPPTTLGEMARREALRRQLVAPSSHVYTNQDFPEQTTPPPPVPPPPPVIVVPEEALEKLPPPKPGVAPLSASTPIPPADTKHDEAWWRDRITKARQAVDRDQMLADALQSRINALTSDAINRDDPAQKALLFDQRQKAIDELDRQNKKIEADRKEIQAVLDDAKKNDVPVGWIR